MSAERQRVTYGKLVRDRIPEIISAEGFVPEIQILEKDEYRAELNRKLSEETAEYLESENLEELADILEVVDALCKAQGHSLEELQSIRKKKRDARGGFERRIYLVAKK